MKYTKEEKLNIGRRIYEGELTRYQAAEEYDIGENTARSYMRMYRDLNQLPPKEKGLSTNISDSVSFTWFSIKEICSISAFS